MGKRFPKSCERIIKGVKKSRNRRVNPFAIALSNKKCRSDFRKKHKK